MTFGYLLAEIQKQLKELSERRETTYRHTVTYQTTYPLQNGVENSYLVQS